MKILSNSKFKAVSRFIQKHARPLDRALFEYSFGNISPNDVVPPLTAYQNGDGGFGHGLEPDFQTPDSSAIASTIACQYIQKFGLKDHRVIRRSMSYFEKTYDKEIDGWKPVPRIVNKFPHAPWWHIDEKTGKCPIEHSWANPTVEILGYLHTFSNTIENEELKRLTEKAINNLIESEEVEEHSLYCYLRMYECVNVEVKNKMFNSLDMHITQRVNTNPEDWKTKYVPTPLNFVDSPKSQFYEKLKDSINENLDFLISQLESNEAWFPTWSWGQYEKEWENARVEWAGKITVENLLKLKKFGRIKI